jgi:hypothetical protein
MIFVILRALNGDLRFLNADPWSGLATIMGYFTKFA